MKAIVFFLALIPLCQELMASDSQKVYIAANIRIDGTSIVWPIISLPDEKVPNPESIYCENAEFSCTLPIRETSAAFGMSHKGKLWFDAAGVKHTAKSGYYNTNPLGGAGDTLVGFTIGGKRKNKPTGEIESYGGVMASDSGLISEKAIRNIDQADGVLIKRILASWKKRYLLGCGQYCAKNINGIASINNLELRITEYKLPSGKILQHISGDSKKSIPKQRARNGNSALYLVFDVWKYNDTSKYIEVNRLESTDCSTQCSGGWIGSPDAIEYRNAVYLMGEHHGGTVFGYYFFRVNSNTLELLSSLTGGS